MAVRQPPVIGTPGKIRVCGICKREYGCPIMVYTTPTAKKPVACCPHCGRTHTSGRRENRARKAKIFSIRPKRRPGRWDAITPVIKEETDEEE